MLDSWRFIRPPFWARDGRSGRAGHIPTEAERARTDTASAISRQHFTAISRLLSAMDSTRCADPEIVSQPRLRDACKAKAEILLSAEETHAVRNSLIAAQNA